MYTKFTELDVSARIVAVFCGQFTSLGQAECAECKVLKGLGLPVSDFIVLEGF